MDFECRLCRTRRLRLDQYQAASRTTAAKPISVAADEAVAGQE
jgi:hypothetical protein